MNQQLFFSTVVSVNGQLLTVKAKRHRLRRPLYCHIKLTGVFVASPGKRHGKGEGLIVSSTGLNHSTANRGFYCGGWKHNMRFASY